MKLKSFLLGSGLVLAMAAPAAAADLSIAEPVDYVRVCDAFGTGYWYIPGTDTCLKIGGYVRLDARYREAAIVADGHSGNWDFRTRARLNIWATSETDMGTLTGFIRMQGTYDNSSSSTNGVVQLDRAWLSLGHLLAGREISTFDYSGGYTLDTGGYRSDSPVDQIRISKKFDNVGLLLALEDGRDRQPQATDVPDVIGALTFSEGPFDAKVSAAFVDHWNAVDYGYAFQLGASMKLDEIAKGDAIRFVAGYAQDAGSFTGALATLGSSYGGGTSWNVLGSAQHYWSSKFSTAVTGSYVHGNNGVANHAWQAAISGAYVPVKNLTLGAEFNYAYNTTKSDPDTWTALFRIVRDIQ